MALLYILKRRKKYTYLLGNYINVAYLKIIFFYLVKNDSRYENL